MKSWMPVLLCLSFLYIPVGISAEEVERTMEQRRLQAYQDIRRGDTARDQRLWGAAVTHYHNALDRYKALTERDPNWEPDYLAFRIAYCEREMSSIANRTERSVADWLAEHKQSGIEETDRYRALYLTAVEQNRYLMRRIEQLEEELDMYLEMEAMEEERRLRQESAPERVEPRTRVPLPAQRMRPEAVPMPGQ